MRLSRGHWSFASISMLAALAVPRIAVGQIRLGSELQVNSYTTNVQSGASVAASAAGDFVVTWESSHSDHRLSGSVQPLIDGLLVQRALFGFTGSTLTSGAVGGGYTRCDAAAIEPYLVGLTQ